MVFASLIFFTFFAFTFGSTFLLPFLLGGLDGPA